MPQVKSERRGGLAQDGRCLSTPLVPSWTAALSLLVGPRALAPLPMVRNTLTGHSMAHKEKSKGPSKAKMLKKLHSSVRGSVASSMAHIQEHALPPGVLPLPPPAAEKRVIGRAVVLAHGAGGSSSHSSMKAWKARLQPLCDDVLMVDFPRPHQLSTQLAAFTDAIRRALKMGHKRVVLVGVGMGARIALTLLSGVTDEEEQPPTAPPTEPPPAPPLPAKLRDSVVGVVALGYPLMRIGSAAARDAPLRALGADSPPVLLVSGSKDAHMDLTKLEAARAATPARTAVHIAEGADGSLRVPGGEQLGRAAADAVDAAMGSFVGEAMGEAKDVCTEIWVETEAAKKAKKRAKRLAEEAAEEARAAKAARAAAKAALANPAPTAVDAAASAPAASSSAAALSSEAAASTNASTEPAPEWLELSGCGSTAVNGRYELDGSRDGAPSYRQKAGEGDGARFTIERDSAPGQATQWCLCVDYGYASWCFIDADTSLPPSSGWSVGDSCEGPPPSLSACPEAAQQLPAPPEPISQPADDDMSDGEEDVGEARADRPRKVQRRRAALASKGGRMLSRGHKKKMRSQRRF